MTDKWVGACVHRPKDVYSFGSQNTKMWNDTHCSVILTEEVRTQECSRVVSEQSTILLPLSLSASQPGDASNRVQPQCPNLLSKELEARGQTRRLIRTWGKWEKRGRTDSQAHVLRLWVSCNYFKWWWHELSPDPRLVTQRGFRLQCHSTQQHPHNPTIPQRWGYYRSARKQGHSEGQRERENG